MKRILLSLTLLLAALPLAAQSSRRATNQNSFASDFQTIPVMGNVAGVGGARFQTYVAVLNPTASAFTVNVALYDANGTRHDATINLAAGEMKTYPNFLDAIFNYQGGGAVTFSTAETAGGTRNNRVVVVAQSYTAGTKYGTTLPSLEFPGSASKSYAPGVSVNSESRTNIGCFNQSSSSNTIHATVYDASGKNVIGTTDIALPANAWGQTAITSVVTDGYIQFAPSDAAVCYASVVNNTTNDAHFVMAAEYTP